LGKTRNYLVSASVRGTGLTGSQHRLFFSLTLLVLVCEGVKNADYGTVSG
jgi:hypothetical protein